VSPQRRRPTKDENKSQAATSASKLDKSRKKTTAALAAQEDDELTGDSLYKRAKDQFGEDKDGLYEYLRVHRLNDPSLCLGYYLMRAQREMNLNQSDVAERTGTRTEQPISRSFLSAALSGRSGIRADTWARIAHAVDANPLEFFISEGWIDSGHIAAYQVPAANIILPLATKLEQIKGRQQQLAAVSMLTAVLDTVLIQQASTAPGERVPSA
jgi:hypothetical protein